MSAPCGDWTEIRITNQIAEQEQRQMLQNDNLDPDPLVQVADPSQSEIMADLAQRERTRLPTVPTPCKQHRDENCDTQNDGDEEDMTEGQREANDNLRFEFCPALHTLLRNIHAEDPSSLLHDFDELVPFITPSEVEYLAAFLTALIPRGIAILVTNIKRDDLDLHEPIETLLCNFALGVSDLFKLLKTYHEAAKKVNNIKVLELHLELLVSLKTEMCSISSHLDEMLLHESSEESGTDPDITDLTTTRKAIEFLDQLYENYISIAPGWIIHADIGPRLIHAIHAVLVLRWQKRIRYARIDTVAPEESTTVFVLGAVFLTIHKTIDALIKREFLEKVRPGMILDSLGSQIARIVSYYKINRLIDPAVNLRRCDGLQSCPRPSAVELRLRTAETFRKPVEGGVAKRDIRDTRCLVRKLCDVAIPNIVAKVNSVVPDNICLDVFDKIVITLAESWGIELRVDESKGCRFRLKRCPCWNDYRW